MSRSPGNHSSRRTPPAAASNVQSPSSGRPDWRWRTFPVFTAFVVGLLVAALINGEPNNTAAAVLVWVAVIGCSYALAHLLVVRFLAPRRPRANASADAAEQFEDVVVYPKD